MSTTSKRCSLALEDEALQSLALGVGTAPAAVFKHTGDLEAVARAVVAHDLLLKLERVSVANLRGARHALVESGTRHGDTSIHRSLPTVS
jgi:hypothetical protein